MSGFYSKPYRRAGSGGGAWQVVARKMLAYLANMRSLGGAETMVIRRQMPDGSTVIARFVKDQPEVLIIESDAGVYSCAIYMESGCIDLGLPDDEAVVDGHGLYTYHNLATITYADEDKAVFGEPDPSAIGLHARAVFQQGGLTSGTTPVSGVSHALQPTAACTREDKINAQAKAPASMFSGLMRLFVQAHYGCPQSSYSGDVGQVVIDGMTITAATGLVDLGQHSYRFVTFADGTLSVGKPRYTKCGELVLALIKRIGDAERKRRLSAYLFTQMRPPAEWVEVPFEGPDGWGGSYKAIAYSPTASEVSLVAWDGSSKTSMLTLLISSAAGAYEASPTGDTWHELPMAAMQLLSHRSHLTDGTIGLGQSGGWRGFHDIGQGVETGAYDAPVHCRYLDDGALEVVRYGYTARVLSLPEALLPGCSGVNGQCHNEDYGNTYVVTAGFYSDRFSAVGLSEYTVPASDPLPEVGTYLSMQRLKRHAQIFHPDSPGAATTLKPQQFGFYGYARDLRNGADVATEVTNTYSVADGDWPNGPSQGPAAVDTGFGSGIWILKVGDATHAAECGCPVDARSPFASGGSGNIRAESLMPVADVPNAFTVSTVPIGYLFDRAARDAYWLGVARSTPECLEDGPLPDGWGPIYFNCNTWAPLSLHQDEKQWDRRFVKRMTYRSRPLVFRPSAVGGGYAVFEYITDDSWAGDGFEDQQRDLVTKKYKVDGGYDPSTTCRAACPKGTVGEYQDLGAETSFDSSSRGIWHTVETSPAADCVKVRALSRSFCRRRGNETFKVTLHFDTGDTQQTIATGCVDDSFIQKNVGDPDPAEPVWGVTCQLRNAPPTGVHDPVRVYQGNATHYVLNPDLSVKYDDPIVDDYMASPFFIDNTHADLNDTLRYMATDPAPGVYYFGQSAGGRTFALGDPVKAPIHLRDPGITVDSFPTIKRPSFVGWA